MAISMHYVYIPKKTLPVYETVCCGFVLFYFSCSRHTLLVSLYIIIINNYVYVRLSHYNKDYLLTYLLT